MKEITKVEIKKRSGYILLGFLIVIVLAYSVDVYFDLKFIESKESSYKTSMEFCGDLTCQNEENFLNCKLDCVSMPIYQLINGG